MYTATILVGYEVVLAYFFLNCREIYQREEGEELVQGEQLRLKGVPRAKQEEQEVGGDFHRVLWEVHQQQPR